MSSCRQLPRIRIESSDSCIPHDLSPSSTLNIRDVLGHAAHAMLSSLLAEEFKAEDIDDALFFGEDYSQHVPAFPDGHGPPLFTVNSHRARLPFALRPEAFELGDLRPDEQYGSLLLTAPTIPRMKLMIMEKLYVQKWVDTLTFDNPPKHIPWTSNTPSTQKRWISEGSIFPVDLIKSAVEQGQSNRGRTECRNADKQQTLQSGFSSSRDSRKRMAPYTVAPPILAKPIEVITKLPRREKKTCTSLTQGPRRRIASTPQSLTSPPSAAPNGTIRTTPDASFALTLATRRGKAVSGLELRGPLIEELEYPDIPTAFRGSPSVWSPQFEAQISPPFFTVHQDMLEDLKSKSAALGTVSSLSDRKLNEDIGWWPEIETNCDSVDAFTYERKPSLALVSYDIAPQGSFDEFLRVHRGNVAETSLFLPRDISTPVKGPRLGQSYPRSPVTTVQSLDDHFNSPPDIPLPPRPALVSPSTPPHVRGILKKTKSVRFEDTMIRETQTNGSPPILLPSEPILKPFSPLRQATITFPQRPRTPMCSKLSEPAGPAKMKDSLGYQKYATENRAISRPRLTPRRIKLGGEVASLPSKGGNVPVPPVILPLKSIPTNSSVDRPCRITHTEDHAGLLADPLAQGKQRGPAVLETGVRRGIEGVPKHRLSIPLRNIFRFK